MLRRVRVVPAVAALLGIGSAAFAVAPGLPTPADRSAFRRWFTFLAESRYYAHKPLREVSDGYSLIRWAGRHALASHDVAWSRTVELPIFPAMPSVRAKLPFAGRFEPQILTRDLSLAQPGDILLFRRANLTAHVMIYIGQSQIVPSPDRWVIYISGKRTHKVPLAALRCDPTPEWRPVPGNPDFLGVSRLDILEDR